MSRRPIDNPESAAFSPGTNPFDLQARLLSRSSFPLTPCASATSVPQVQAQDRMTLEIQNQELRSSHEALRRARARYLELFDFAPVPYFVFDERHLIQELNLAGVDLLREEKGKLKFRPFFPFVAESDRPKFHRHVASVLEQRERLEVELELLKLDGAYQRIRLMSQAVHAEEGDHPVCLSAAILPAEPQTFEAPASAGSVILLVDDEFAVRSITARLVESLGYEVAQASSGPEALEMFRRTPSRYASVFMDFTMPEMDGVSLIRELRQLRRDLPCVLMSGMFEAGSFMETCPDAPTAFLQKPFSLARLEELVATLQIVPTGVGRASFD